MDMNPDNAEFAEVVKKSVALGRYGKPEEIAILKEGFSLYKKLLSTFLLRLLQN